MNSLFPIQLAQKGTFVFSMKYRENELIECSRTIFPIKQKYSVSLAGKAACLISEEALLIYGQLDINGKFESYNVVSLPRSMSPNCIAIVKDMVIIGGKGKDSIIGFCMRHNKLISFEINRDYDFQEVEELQVDGNNLFVVFQKNDAKCLLRLDYSNTHFPIVVGLEELSAAVNNAWINRLVLNSHYFGILFTSDALPGIDKHIDIYDKRDSSRLIKINDNFYDPHDNYRFRWSDIFLLFDLNFLVIAANEFGLGVYKITSRDFDYQLAISANKIRYFEKFMGDVVGIQQIGEDQLIVYLKRMDNNREFLDYTLISISDLLDELGFDVEEEEDDDEENDFYDFRSSNSTSYCSACQESPCMCSDREGTSSIHDF